MQTLVKGSEILYNYFMSERVNELNEKAQNIIKELEKMFPDAACELNFSDNFELLVAVILSSQCTDKRVNIVTKNLFSLYKTPEDFAGLETEKLEKLIYSCGFYKNKAKNIIGASRDIVEKFGGLVPDTLEGLMSLSGVGKKTANVVLSEAYNVPAIAVDTHVFRTSRRLALSASNNAKGVEADLQNALPRELWGRAHHLLVLFGRYKCKSLSPECQNCALKHYCIYEGKENAKS
jgi:endonuclease-3